MTNEVIRENERGTYVVLDTSYADGTQDDLRGESPTVTEPS